MKKSLMACTGLLVALLLLLGLASATADTQSIEEYRQEGYTIADLADTIYDSEGSVVLSKDVTYLRETENGGISRNGNSFSLASGKYQKIAAPDGQQTKYCILSGGRLFFGDRNESSGSETIILDNLHELNPVEIFLGGDKPRDQMMLQAVVGQAAEGADPDKTAEELSQDLTAKLADLGDPVKFIFFNVNQDFDINIDFIEDVLPFYAKGNFTLYGEYRYDNPGMFEYSMHDIHVYVDLNITDIGIKSAEVVTDTYERAIITYEDWLDLATVKATLHDFIGEVAWYMHGHFGFKIHFETFYGPVAEDDWYCKLDDDNMYDMGIAHVKGKGDLELGITVGPSITLDQVITHTGLGGKMDFGFAMTNIGSPDRFKPADTKDQWHICDECVQEEIRSFAGPSYVYLDLPFGSDCDLEWDFSDRVYSDPIKTFYFSNTFDECEDGDCPHWAWHTPTEVCDEDYNLLQGVDVSYSKVPSHCDPYASGTTGADGAVDLYMPPGSYEIEAKAVSPLDPDWVISKSMKYTKNDGDPYGVQIKLPIPKINVYFKNSQSGEATEWPEDKRFSPFYEKDVTLPDTIPGLSGRQFIGWNTAEDGTGISYAPGTTLTPEDDLTLWAQWDLAGNSWYVIYNANGGTKAPEPQIITMGEDAELSWEAPEFEKMIFRGWATDPDAVTAEYQPGDLLPYDSSKDVVVLYALWELNPPERPWILTFQDSLPDAASGIPDSISIQPSISQDVLIPNQIPEKSGRAFTGWNTAQDGSGRNYSPGSTITLTGDTTLWAQWTLAENAWVLIYNANGGTGAPSPAVIQADYVAIISVQKPVHGSMKFLGWALSPDAAEAEYQPLDLLHNTEGKPVVVLYAVWELSPGPRPIHIAFNANGLQDAGLPADIWQDRGIWVRLEPAVAPLGSAYAFRGWSEDPGAKDPEYLAGHPYPFDKDTVLYAIWGQQDTVTLTFRDSLQDAASGIPDPITIVPSMSRDVRIPSQIPQKSGRTFIGWNTARDGSGTSYAPGSTITLPEDTTLWAQWDTAGNSWFIIYDANGGTKAPGAQIVPKGQNAVLTSELPEAGTLVFKGWATDPNAAAAEYQPGDTLLYDSEKNVVVLYALWNLDPAHRPIIITFNANGLQEASLPADVWMEQNSWLQLEPAAAPLGSAYTFRGWSEDPGAKDPEYLAGKTYHFDHDTALFAIWDNLDTVTLTFLDSLPGDASGIPAPITILPSMSRDVRIPDDIPEKGGRVFIGWNTAQNGRGTYYAPGSVITLQKSATLWAQWDLAGDSWYIIYDANGGTKAPGAQIVPKGQNAVLTSELPEAGTMVFKGWATDPHAAEPEYQPGDTLLYDSGKNTVVLYALWNLDPAHRPIIITFDANGGQPDTAPGKISVPQGTWVLLPAHEPSWDEQHDFLGWSKEHKATEPEWKPGSVVLFTQDTTLYAIWNAHYKVIEGAGSVWTKGSGKTQRFVADGDVKYFKELRVDGLPFNEGVKISSGSTIADIRAKAMEKLSVGKHTVTFVYMDGEASASFTVQKKLPPTGDTGHPMLWLGLIMLGIMGIVLWGGKRKNKAKD